MPALFGGGDKGPTAAEILAKQREEAERKARDLLGLARRDKNTGVTAQLLGDRKNTSFKTPTTASAPTGFSADSAPSGSMFGKSKL